MGGMKDSKREKGGKLILENGYKVWTNFDQC